MTFKYSLYAPDGFYKGDITFDELCKTKRDDEWWEANEVSIKNLNKTGNVLWLLNEDDFLGWQTKLERDHAWKPNQVKGQYEAMNVAMNIASRDIGVWNPFDENETDIHVEDRSNDLSYYKELEEKERGVKKYLGKTPVNPSHYQAFMNKPAEGKIKDYPFPELQWLESVQYKGAYRDPDIFVRSVLLQADKYLSRLGKKDNMVQEIMKGIWYLKFVAAYVKNCGPIRVVDIEEILGDEV